MFAILFDTQRAALTVGAFIGTFFVALSIGRLLKRRAGVRLGILYQLFCLTLAFYVALAVYGVHATWRNHIGAAAILLSTAFVVALINRYLWDWYFEKRKKIAIPHFLRELMAGVMFLVVLLLVLSFGYHAESSVEGRARRLRRGCDHSWFRWPEFLRRDHRGNVDPAQSALQGGRLAENRGDLR